MKEAPYQVVLNEEEENFDLKEILFRYLRFWPWFLLALGLSVAAGIFFLRYTPVSWSTTAKIKIIDDSQEMDIASGAMSMITGKPQINLDNEIEVLKSYRLLSQVVEDLHLDVEYFEVGDIMTSQRYEVPFLVEKHISEDSLKSSLDYRINVEGQAFRITNIESEAEFRVPFGSQNKELPFRITRLDNRPVDPEANFYKVTLLPFKEAVMGLQENLKVSPTNKDAEILSLSMEGQSPQRSEEILNTIIEKFNQDGILDRQLVSQRTLDFIDDRFLYLSQELDSIEGSKKTFKQENNLSYIEGDAALTLQKRSEAEAEVFQLQTQLELAKLLKQTLAEESKFSLLPADIGLENSSINQLVNEYNDKVLEREKLLAGAGENNPTVSILSSQLGRAKQNLENTVNVYKKQLELSMRQLRMQEFRAESQFARLPEKEQLLRAIERQQSIKENLFLLLLQKREEAAIALAVTAPSIKVVDYALTGVRPVDPKPSMVLGISLLMGLLLPFGVLYTRFALDTKLRDRNDLENEAAELPVLVEVPHVEGDKNFMEANDRSVLAESFRILSTNLNYTLPKKTGEAHVVYVTSSVKGEGKTLTALNLSLAYASINKKVLLVGADLRNPQLHTYYNLDKNDTGLSDYLMDDSVKWQDCIHQGFRDNPYHKITFSGRIPPNAPQLLSGHRFREFIEEVKQDFDIVIVDTAPTVLVTDTLIISELADVTVYLTRAGYTEKRLLEHVNQLHKGGKLKNIGLVLNDVKSQGRYSYNYGYGYGYSESTPHMPWYKKIFGKA